MIYFDDLYNIVLKNPAIKEAKKGVRRKETTTVYLTCFLRSDKKHEEFSCLHEAIDYANNWDNEEGEYPLEYEAPWTIHFINRRSFVSKYLGTS